MPIIFFIINLFFGICFLNLLYVADLLAKTLVIDGVGSHEENITEKSGKNENKSDKNIITQTTIKKPIYSRILIPESLVLSESSNLYDLSLDEKTIDIENYSSSYTENKSIIKTEDGALESNENVDNNIGYDTSSTDMMESVTNKVDIPQIPVDTDNSNKKPIKNTSLDTIVMLPDASESLGELNEIDTSNLTIYFEEGSAEISENYSDKIVEFASKVSGEIYKISIYAYAIKKGEKTSAARRLSLSRALAVRKIFMKSGISSEDMQVRALGDNFESEAADKVEINLSKN